MQPSRSPSASRLRGALAAVLACLLLVGVGGTSAAAGAPTRAAVQHVQPGAGDDRGPASSATHHAVTPHAAKVGVPKRHGPHPGTTAATLHRSAPVTTAGTPDEAGPGPSLHLTRSLGSSDGRAPPA